MVWFILFVILLFINPGLAIFMLLIAGAYKLFVKK